MTQATPTLTWRAGLLNLVPRWLKGRGPAPDLETGQDLNAGHWSYRVLYAIGVVQDAIGTAFNFGMQASCPGYGDEYALSLIGRSRGILRGPGEASASYANRLLYWRQSRRRKGNAFALMEQMQAFLLPYGFRIRIQYDNGVMLQLAPGGYLNASTGYTVGSGALLMSRFWDWGTGQHAARFWVLLCPIGTSPWVSDATWADQGYWLDHNTDDGTATGQILDPLASHDTTPTWGSTASYSTVQSLLALLREWSPPSSIPMGIVLCWDTTAMDAINPTNAWDRLGSRDPNYVYWEL